MDNKKRGIALIINNSEFGSHEIQNREGSDLDVKRLETVLKSMKFEVHRKNNQTAAEIKNLLEEYSKNDYEDSDCFLSVIMSHGLGSLGVFGTDLKEDLSHLDSLKNINSYAWDGTFNWEKFTSLVDVRKEIYEKFSLNKSLSDKPKLFFINASSVNSELNSGSAKLINYTRMNDFLIDYSSVDDLSLVKERDPTEGSIYIQELTETLTEQSKREHLTDMITTTHRKTFEKVGRKQQPVVEQSLIRKIYFL